jgi:hypothetical protein
MIWKAGVAAALALAAAVGCGGKSARKRRPRGAETPKDVLRAYFKAIQAKDADTLMRLSVKDIRAKMAGTKKNNPEQFKMMMDMMFKMAGEDVKGLKIGEPGIRGDRAVFTWKRGPGRTTTATLVKEAGGWKVAKIKTEEKM